VHAVVHFIQMTVSLKPLKYWNLSCFSSGTLHCLSWKDLEHAVHECRHLKARSFADGTNISVNYKIINKLIATKTQIMFQ